jgi:hypothetical protein
MIRLLGDDPTPTRVVAARMWPGRPEVQACALVLTAFRALARRQAVAMVPNRGWVIAASGRLILADADRNPPRRYRSSYQRRKYARARRARLAAAGACINGEHHGPATRGKRCDACAETHRRSA